MKNILFYSWDKVVKDSKGNSILLLDKFLKFNLYGVPKHLSGNSFLINSYDLLINKHTEQEKIDYLYLASLRNYFDFKYQNISGLYYYFSDLATERVINNKTLSIEKDYIKFKYEDKYGH